jgi:uncharacterized damage-inducible protein DinB
VPSILVEMFKHNTWANTRLIDACAELSDAALDAGAVGTYGSARDTLVHLFGAQGRYVAALRGTPADDAVREDQPFPGFDVLRQHARSSGAALEELAATLPEEHIVRRTYQGQERVIPAGIFLTQAINHATEHRAHIMTIMTQQGVEPPTIDGWAYGRAIES